MAREFDANLANFLEVATPAITGVPCTLACWCRSDSLTISQVPLAVSDAATNTGFLLFVGGATANDPLRALSVVNGTARLSSINNYPVSTWFHAAGVFASTTSRTVYMDGVAGAVNTQPSNPTGLDRTTVGKHNSSVSELPFDGRVAEAAIWNVALTANEISMLASGVSPLRVRPGNLKFYVPLFASETGNAVELSGNGLTLTENGIVGIADHAPIAPPFGFDLGWRGAFAAAAGGTTFFQTLAATAVGSSVLVDVVIFPKTLAATAVGVGNLSRTLTFARALAATAVGVATLTKGMFVTLAATATGVAGLTKGMFQTLAAAAVGNATLSAATVFARTLAATATGLATLATQLVGGVTMAATAVGVATLTALEVTGQTLAAIAVGVASLAAQFIAGTGAVVEQTRSHLFGMGWMGRKK